MPYRSIAPPSSLRLIAVLFAVAALLSRAFGAVTLPAHFCDHMVLQQGVRAPIWGKAAPGERVEVSIGERSVTAVADDNGEWRVALPELPAGGPLEIKVRGENEIVLRDVLVGEVWLASGQSNMDFTVARTEKYYFAGVKDADREIAAATYPQIRMFTADWTMSTAPQRNVAGTWRVCDPTTVGEFSAVAYFFARMLHRDLKVPVGIITCTYGASTAQAWTSRERLAANPLLAHLLEKFDAARAAYQADPALGEKYAAGIAKWERSAAEAREKGAAVPRKPKHPDPVQDQHNPTVLFNGMIAPIIPYALRGVIWYQGESNTGDARIYPAMQAALIEDWRERWAAGGDKGMATPRLPFYIVQIANHHAPAVGPGNSRLATFREAQSKVLTLPDTGMAVTIDIGEEKDVHPRNKQDVGWRLSQLALARTYRKAIEDSGPVLAAKEVDGSSIRLRFTHATGGLVARGGPLKHFAIAGTDRRFVWADARIDGEIIIVNAASVPAPMYVRYAWADNPEGCNLFNAAGIPAGPFRTDD